MTNFERPKTPEEILGMTAQYGADILSNAICVLLVLEEAKRQGVYVAIENTKLSDDGLRGQNVLDRLAYPGDWEGALAKISGTLVQLSAHLADDNGILMLEEEMDERLRALVEFKSLFAQLINPGRTPDKPPR